MAEVEVARYRHEREGALMVGAAHPIRVLESTKYRSKVCVGGGGLVRALATSVPRTANVDKNSATSLIIKKRLRRLKIGV